MRQTQDILSMHAGPWLVAGQIVLSQPSSSMALVFSLEWIVLQYYLVSTHLISRNGFIA